MSIEMTHPLIGEGLGVDLHGIEEFLLKHRLHLTRVRLPKHKLQSPKGIRYRMGKQRVVVVTIQRSKSAPMALLR
jgi:hypothetical protein